MARGSRLSHDIHYEVQHADVTELVSDVRATHSPTSARISTRGTTIVDTRVYAYQQIQIIRRAVTTMLTMAVVSASRKQLSGIDRARSLTIVRGYAKV